MISFSPLKHVFVGKRSILTYSVSVLYLFLPGIVINYRLFLDAFTGGHSLSYTMQLLFTLLTGSLLRFTNLELLFVVLNSILVGTNISLLIFVVQNLRKQKSLTVAVGGSSLIALLGAGCASCGISIVSVLGISGAFLPFHGIWYSLVSMILLILSLFFLLKNKNVCQIP